MTPWTPTADGLPDSDMTVLVHNPRAAEPVWLGYHDGAQWRDIDGLPTHGVTHWQDLPPGPEEGQ